LFVVGVTAQRISSPEDVIIVMSYAAYQLYQAERSRSDAERRQADASLGTLAASAAGLRRGPTRPRRAQARAARLLRALPSRG
jgi:hypothetical protein